MTLSYHLGYLETILVHLTRRQGFAGKTDLTFFNIWDLVMFFHLKLEQTKGNPQKNKGNDINKDGDGDKDSP